MAIQPTRIASVDFAGGVNNLLRQFRAQEQQQLQEDALRLNTEHRNRMFERLKANDAQSQENFERQQGLRETQASKPDVSPQLRLFQDVQRNPGLGNFVTNLKKAGAPSVSNTTNIAAPKFQSKFDETTGKVLGEEAVTIAKSGASAAGKIGTLTRMKTALDTGIATGFGQKQLLTLRRAGQTLGIKTKGLGETEMLEALGNRMALELRNPSGGAGMPGAMSDKDREFLSASVPGLDKTREGNAKLIEYGIRLEKRNQDVAKFAAQYRKQNNGRLDLQFYDQLAQWSAQNPMFSDADRVQVQQVPQAPQGGEVTIDLDGNLIE